MKTFSGQKKIKKNYQPSATSLKPFVLWHIFGTFKAPVDPKCDQFR